MFVARKMIIMEYFSNNTFLVVDLFYLEEY